MKEGLLLPSRQDADRSLEMGQGGHRGGKWRSHS